MSAQDIPPGLGTPDPALIAALRAGGHRLTPQRLFVLDVVRADPGHLTAETVVARVTAVYPYINRATVYRALAWLTQQGLLCVTDLGHGPLEYQYLGLVRHHHLICLRCGAMEEFRDDLVAPLATAIRARHGFAPRLDHLAVYGLCAACQTASDDASPEGATA